MKKNSLLTTYLQLIIVAISWGGAFVAAKLAVTSEGFTPFTAAISRFGLASLVLICIILLRKERLVIKLTPTEWAKVLCLGLTGVFGYNALFFTGLKYTSSISGSLIVAINPVVTIVLSVIVLKERVNRLQALGILVSFLGVVTVVSKGSLANVLALQFNRGDLLLLGAPLCWAVYSVLGKLVMQKLSPLVSTAYACSIGTLMLTPFALLETSRTGFQLKHVTPTGWVCVTYMALFASVLGFVWWYKGIAKIGPSKSSIFVNMVPLSNLLMSSVILAESITFPQMFGAGAVIAGVYLSSRSGKISKGIVTQSAK